MYQPLHMWEGSLQLHSNAALFLVLAFCTQHHAMYILHHALRRHTFYLLINHIHRYSIVCEFTCNKIQLTGISMRTLYKWSVDRYFVKKLYITEFSGCMECSEMWVYYNEFFSYIHCVFIYTFTTMHDRCWVIESQSENFTIYYTQ